MNKFSFTYLIKDDEMVWNDFYISINLLCKNIINKLNCKYSVELFVDKQPSENSKKKIVSIFNKYKNIKIVPNFHIINLAQVANRPEEAIRPEKYNYLIPIYFPNPSNNEMPFSLGYRDMCSFFTYPVFNHESIKNSEYFIRLDTDSFFINVNDSFIRKLSNITTDYGYLEGTVQQESSGVHIGFGQTLYDYYKSLNLLTNENLKILSEASYSPKIYYTNFEVVKVSWGSSVINKRFFDLITNAKGIYKYRWGDALIRYYLVNLTNASKTILNGALYKHSGIYDSRQLFRKYISKVYRKITKVDYKKNLENSSSFIDKIFIGL